MEWCHALPVRFSLNSDCSVEQEFIQLAIFPATGWLVGWIVCLFFELTLRLNSNVCFIQDLSRGVDSTLKLLESSLK